MIKLSEANKDQLICFIEHNPTLNLFYMGDYLAYGFDSQECEYFGLFRDNQLEVCVLRYQNSLHISGNFMIPEEELGFFELYNTYKPAHFNTGSSFAYLIDKFNDPYTVERCMLSVYTPQQSSGEASCVKKLDADRAAEYLSVQETIFQPVPDTDKFIENIKKKTVEGFYIEDHGRIVSIASATAFTPDAAMIIGVGTLEAYRNKGYAMACVKVLCDFLYQRNQKGVLFYVNPEAGKIYHTIGFIDQEPYYLVRFTAAG